jgi:hypothetical protein
VAYEDEKVRNGRKPAWLVEITCTSCANVYGVAPCTAAGAAGSECHNTRSTCQDKSNFAAIDKTHYHANRIIPLPAKEGGTVLRAFFAHIQPLATETAASRPVIRTVPSATIV